mmetsp:Transcript_16369/g.23299  ORF Transcript_16369/g.23299 Transcript_16369/m.23299 type:complete len:157 (+) Transcript_16369:449-919(+)
MRRLDRGASDQQKHYIVLVSRGSTATKTQGEVWPVHIAEIDTVIPRLTYRSFLPGRYLRISSKVKIKKTTQQHWFNIPASHCDYSGIAKEVYDDFFPGSWKNFMEEKEGNKNKSKAREEEKCSVVLAPTIEDLRGELDKLKCGDSDEDWENCYDSE